MLPIHDCLKAQEFLVCAEKVRDFALGQLPVSACPHKLTLVAEPGCLF